MTGLLLFLAAAALGLWVLNRGAPWDKTVRRDPRDQPVDLTGRRP